jgi:hypothetical protein
MTISEVKEQFQVALEEGSSYFQLITRLDDSRYCRWPGQAEDGRKYSKFYQKQVFPWEGASDIRPFYIDALVNDDVSIMRTADQKCHMQAMAANSDNDALARAVTNVLDYVSRSLLAEEMDREREFAANWRQHYGSSVIGVDWLYEMDSEQKTVSIQDLMQIAQADPQFGAVLQFLISIIQSGQQPNQQDIAAAIQEFQQYFPQVPQPMQAFQSLMQTGSFSFNQPYARTDRPTITAYRTFQDVFFPRSTFDIQRAPWVVRRDVLNKPQVEDKAIVEQWDPEFTKFVLNTKGGSVIYQLALDSTSRWGDRIQIDELRDLYEVFYGFYRGNDTQGNRQTQVCIFHPGTTTIGRQLPLPYSHGKYPFILCRREKRSRSALESRGVGDIADVAQSEIKVQRDSRNDRTSISTIPPLLVPLGRGKQQYRLGPGAQLGVLRPGELGWLAPPPMDNSSFDTENATRRDTADYFGKNLEGVDPNKVLRVQQRLIDAWLAENREVMVQVFQLCQQFMSQDEWARISGAPDLQLPSDRSTIQNNMTLVLEFDARDLNMDYLEQKLQLINTALVGTDAAGVIDRAGLTQYAARALDPALGARIIRPQGQVTQAEIEDEQAALSQIQTGITPPIYQPNSGQNPQLRLQVIQSAMQAPDFIHFLQQNPLAQQRLEQRMQAFQFAIQQTQNAQIGKIGVQPSPITQATGGVAPAPPPQTPPS